ncbi:MAG: hypothetical protein CMB89_15285, partial [Flammeovirgaceae bacterium]|nr:hypothetical protein [Flammeovirgaceae bacterium]
AYRIAHELKPFSFHQFKERMFKLQVEEDHSLNGAFQQYADAKYQDNKIRTYESYISAKNSFNEYLKSQNIDNTSFQLYDINSDFLKNYERWAIGMGKSLSTVGVYTRNLRTLINRLIDKGVLEKKNSPFKKGGFTIPATRKTNICLELEEVQVLHNFNTINTLYRLAVDFWFISFLTNGANMKDLLNLRIKDLLFDYQEIQFIREKTKDTTRADLEVIRAPLTNELIELIKSNGRIEGDRMDYVFDVLNGNMNEEEKTRTIKNYTNKVSNQLKKLAKEAGIKTNVSFQTARHTFSNMVLNEGGTTEFIQFALGHKSQRTTQRYLKGFSSNKKLEMTKKLLKGINN